MSNWSTLKINHIDHEIYITVPCVKLEMATDTTKHSNCKTLKYRNISCQTNRLHRYRYCESGVGAKRWETIWVLLAKRNLKPRFSKWSTCATVTSLYAIISVLLKILWVNNGR